MYRDILRTMITFGDSIIKRLFRKENIETRLFKKTDFSFIIEIDTELINDILLANDIKKIDYELLCNFFKYPDIKDFIEKIYAPNQSDPLGFFDINKIYSEFGQLVIKYFKLENDKARNFSTQLFDILIEGCNETLTKLVNDGEIQPQNELLNYRSFIEQYQKIREIYKSLNDYKSIPDYLSRKVCSAENYNSSTMLFLSDDSENIFQAIENNKHISLLSEGGMGKTTELMQIAYHYSQSNDSYYPIFVSLNKYTSRNISEYFPSYWNLIPKNKLLVIFDGFDEIQSKNKLDAIREIELFVDNYPDIHVIVSCRNNLYNIGTENIPASLSGFKSYVLVELEHDKIKGYVENKLNSKSSEFFASISRHNLYGLLKIPFYLIHLTEFFKENNLLPTNKAEIFKALLDSRIQRDIAHYRTTNEVDNDKIIGTLEIIALSMECLGRNYITDHEFKQLVPDASSRILIKYCTIWKKQEKGDVTWQFEHNNFQEYLAAKKLSALPFETIKTYIFFKPNYHRIIPSWINTISFLVSLYENQELLDWILLVNPKLCIKFESDKIDKLKRIKIFKEIFGEYKEKRILIGGVWFEYYELARFGQSDEVIEFLLNEAENSIHYTTVVNSIELMYNLDIPFTKKDEVEKFLVKYALDNNYPELVQDYALRCLSIHKFDSKETIDQIVPILKLSENERIRSGLYYFLSNSDSLDEYIDVFLYGVNLVFDRDILSGSELIYLLKGLNKTRSPESIKKILTFFINNKEYLDRLYHQDEILFINNSTDAYLEDSSILDLCLELLKVLLLEYHIDLAKKLLFFFEKTRTRLHAFQKVYSNRNKEKNPFTILAYLADLSCLEFIIEEHKVDKITEKEMWNLKHSLKFDNEEISILFNNLINENFGNRFISLQEENNNDEKRSFPKDIDLLFDKKSFINEIEILFEIDASKEFTRKELFFLKIKPHHQYFSELVFNKLCKIAGSNGTVSLKRTLEYFNGLNWDSFCIENIHNMLERGEEINLSEEQKKIIFNWCKSHIDNVNFKQSISKKDEKVSANHTALILWSFYRKFGVPYPKNTLLDMISFDWLAKSEFVGIEYLENQLSFQDMKKRVLENLNEGIEYDFILRNHIIYCKKHNIKDILEYSLDIIVDTNRDDGTRKLALDTTCEMLDTFLELEQILPKIQDEFKWTVVRKLIDKKDNSCESYLLNIIDNGNEEDQLKAAALLIKLQNLKGLEFYVDWVKKHNKYPDYVIGPPLRTLYRSESIPYLLELLKISYREELIQDHFHSLHRDVLEAFSNVALRSEDDFIEVKRYIEKFIEGHSTEIKDVNFLYSNLEKLEFKYYMGKNENINLDIVIEKLKEHEIY